jgi:hypothetical protein
LVQVTVLPAWTVSVAGANAKLSMLTWSPLTGAAGAVTDVVGIDMEGVTEPVEGREAEHPASDSTLTANAAAVGFRSMAAVMPSNRAAGYTA